jgi:hypothetical protein
MAVPDAFRPQASVWAKFLEGMDISFVLRSVGKVSEARLGRIPFVC